MAFLSRFRAAVPMAVALCLLAGCASGPQFQSDYDRSVDFGRYKTYGFFEPLSMLRGGDLEVRAV